MEKIHQLLKSITADDGNNISEVKAVLITMGQHKKFSEDHKGDEAFLRACITAATGLSLAEIERLTAPDYHSVESLVLELMRIRAGEMIDNFDPAQPQLLQPVEGDDGHLIKRYSIDMPTVKTTDMMKKQTDSWDRTMFISMSCTGMSAAELQAMSLPDWNQLQERLIDFLEKPAAFFRPKT